MPVGLTVAAIAVSFGAAWWLERLSHGQRVEAAGHPPRTHVLLVSIDTLRPDHMSAYGYARETTPNIARFFKNRLFQRARSSAPCTIPSVKQLLSGRLDAQGDPLAVILKRRGFRTAAIVSQHQFVHDTWGYERGFDTWDPSREFDQYDMTTRDAREVTEQALSWLRAYPHDAKPFFLWLHYFDPHDPYNPPLEEREHSREIATYLDGDRRGRQMAAKTDEAHWYLVDRIFSAEDRDNLIRLYDDEIRYMDEQLGRVLDALQTTLAGDKVLVVLTADHGELLGEAGAWDHCYRLDDAELRVPLAVYGFSRWVDRATAQRPVSTLDIVPTLLRALKVPTDKLVLDGQPLWEPRRKPSRAVFEERACAFDASHKLCVDAGAGQCRPHQLIRLKNGLEEGGHPLDIQQSFDTAQRLAASLCTQGAQLQRTIEMTEQDLARLRALGYTE